MTTDGFEGDFPPACYGKTLEEVEATIAQVIECVFRDDDGILRSGVNGRTMKINRPEDIKDRPLGVGTYVENSDIPREFKPVWTNYENAGQASGTYLEALCAKFRATGDENLRELARKTVRAIVTLWENASKIEHPLGGGGKGWLPKPYGGINNVDGMHECSIDQYVDITLGLQSYYLTFADDAEKRKIEEMIVSFADWWFDHDYCGVYLGRAIYWKRLAWHPMSVAGFLYMNALAYSFDYRKKFQDGFSLWLQMKGALENAENAVWSPMHGITLNCIGRLILLRPEMSDYWMRVAECQSGLLVKSIEDTSGTFHQFNQNAYGASYLATAHRLLPQCGYDFRSRQCLIANTQRESFYHIKRGIRIADINPRHTGDDYRDMFMAETHAHWMAAFWNIIPQNTGEGI